MKNLFFFVILNILYTGLFAQVKNDSVFSSSEIIMKTPSGDIFGTLTVPNNLKVSPIVIIIAGSGPTDRDCNSPLGIKTNAYKMLSEGLAENGISSLRFDKRGIGNSKGAMTSEVDLKFETYINDVVSWIALLKKDKRFSKVVLLGHSEGSLIGIVAAEQVNVSGLISVAGVGRPADEILKIQLEKKLPAQLLEESNKILDSLKTGKTVSDVDPSLLALYRPGIQPYMISWMKYDPAQEISKLKIPVLIIQGTTDLQVTVNDAKLLSESYPDAKLLIIQDMNHVLKESDDNMQNNLATYSNPELPLKPELIPEIVNFIKRRQ